MIGRVGAARVAVITVGGLSALGAAVAIAFGSSAGASTAPAPAPAPASNNDTGPAAQQNQPSQPDQLLGSTSRNGNGGHRNQRRSQPVPRSAPSRQSSSHAQTSGS